MERYQTAESKRLFEETKEYLVDGVTSSFHLPTYRDYPILMESGKGAHLTDVDGNDYIDYIQGFGPMLLGYCPDDVNQAVSRQLEKGTHFSAPTRDTLRLCRKLTEIIPCAEKISFANSGTECVMYALRLARAYTGRYKVIKFEGQYHGWSDEEKVTISAKTAAELGERDKPTKILHSKGQRLTSADDLILLPWDDEDLLEKTLKEQGNEIAAVIMEPVMCDSGPILSKPGYLEKVRALTKQYGVVLIFDEVITGFRVSRGGAQEYYGVTPDLATFAKACASGYPMAFVAGKKEIMESTHASGTFNGNALVTAASLATIEDLSKPGVYEHLNELGEQLCKGFEKLAKKYGIKIYARHLGGIFVLAFGYDYDIRDYREWLDKADLPFYEKFVAAMEAYGVRLTDTRGREYISVAHTEEDIEKTLAIADQVLGELLQAA